MLYFLDFVDIGGTVRPDHHGMELLDLEEAARVARQVLGEVAQDTKVSSATTLRVCIRNQATGPVVTTVAVNLFPEATAS